jgi:GNAT superfamily N-acetyltransferase
VRCAESSAAPADGPPLQAESSAGLWRESSAGPAGGAPWRAGVIEGAGQVTGTSRQDLRIRRAGPADIDAVVRLGLEVIRFDAHFGSVTERPETADALWRETAGLLAVPETWTWLAERDGTAIGMLCAERPESAGWIAPMVRPSPVAYLLLMGVAAGERGSGVGTALAARLHREIKATGVAVTLLHYAQLNPLSVPFWSQQGYRPLWTAWEARPARTIR